MVAFVHRDPDTAVFQLRHFDRTVILNLALLAVLTFGKVDLRHALADDSDIVQARFHAVIWTAAHGDLEFVRQIHAVIADVI